MMVRKVMYTLLVVLVWGSAATGCGVTPASHQAPEIRIGVIAPLSGELAATAGQPTVNAAQLAVDEINQQGGLNVAGKRYPVRLFIEDDQDSPRVAVEAARRLIVQHQVVALVGVPASRIAIPVATLAENEHIPLISSSSTNPETTMGKSYAFRIAFVDSFQAQVIARFAYEELETRKAAVLYDVASTYNKDLAEYFKQQFEEYGGQVVAFEPYVTGETDWFPQLSAIQESQAEVLFLPNYTNEVPFQAEQAREMGLSLQLLGSDAWNSVETDLMHHMENGFFTAHWNPYIANQKAQAFIQAYYRAYKTIPQEIAALTYDALGLLFEAIQAQGEYSPAAIREGLATTREYMGVTGTMAYDGSGNPVRSVVILQIKDGRPTYYEQVNP